MIQFLLTYLAVTFILGIMTLMYFDQVDRILIEKGFEPTFNANYTFAGILAMWLLSLIPILNVLVFFTIITISPKKYVNEFMDKE